MTCQRFSMITCTYKVDLRTPGTMANVAPVEPTWASSNRRPSLWLLTGAKHLLEPHLDPPSAPVHYWDSSTAGTMTGLPETLPGQCTSYAAEHTALSALTAPRAPGRPAAPRRLKGLPKHSGGGVQKPSTLTWTAGWRSRSSWCLLNQTVIPCTLAIR